WAFWELCFRLLGFLLYGRKFRGNAQGLGLRLLSVRSCLFPGGPPGPLGHLLLNGELPFGSRPSFLTPDKSSDWFKRSVPAHLTRVSPRFGIPGSESTDLKHSDLC